MSHRLLVLLPFLLSLGFPALGYQEIPVTNGGTIRGQVVLSGPIPAPGVLPVQKNRAVCGEQVPDQSLVVSPNRGVRNVAVVVEGITAGKAIQHRLAVLDNKACAFVPRVQTLVVGQTLELRNSDPILHDAHAHLPSYETLFNLGLPHWRRVRHTLRDTGRIRIDCNVLHTWMRAYLIVTAHPYATISDAEGRFSLDQIPAGAYTLRLWHERLGELSRRVSVGEKQEVLLSVEYRQKNAE
jgi:hypothetical protein